MTPAKAEELWANAITDLRVAIDALFYELSRLRNGAQTIKTIQSASAIEQHCTLLENELTWLESFELDWNDYVDTASGELVESRVWWVNRRVGRAQQLIDSSPSV